MPKVFLNDRAVRLLEEELEALGVEDLTLSDAVVQLVVEARRLRDGKKPRRAREDRPRGQYG